MSRQQFGVLPGSGPGASGRPGDPPRRTGRPRLAGDPTILRRPRAGRAGRHHRLAPAPTTARPATPTTAPGVGVPARPAPTAPTAPDRRERGPAGAADIARIAADAAAAVPGVSGAHPATVRLDDRSVSLDLRLITWYGHSVPAVADAVRAAVADRVAADTRLTVETVTVTVDDLLVPGVDVTDDEVTDRTSDRTAGA
ncbi:Asp23/Gls24 family envelope stress response protein [Micromonospora sp. RHAY321]|uniref:Asp23/Gls24 family envelope stress response protein n=1 Tax=Micromonospora sp. RHAY321 TaxID=2944807 RepID=UPI00207C136B|nr:Asp23/Gls24 family envelope stress response protein [Micromonospora sp. RHAY321]MCO1595000.1 Asp23/Gls24 family envelope stress response protein [Micromonospora sp. RHAY321]